MNYTLNRDYTLASVLGLAVQFRKDEPTYVPPLLVPEVLLLGAEEDPDDEIIDATSEDYRKRRAESDAKWGDPTRQRQMLAASVGSPLDPRHIGVAQGQDPAYGPFDATAPGLDALRGDTLNRRDPPAFRGDVTAGQGEVDAGYGMPAETGRGGEERRAEPTSKAEREAAIKDAIEAVTLRNHRDDFNAGGKPNIKPLAEELGWTPTAAERDAVLAKIAADE